MITKQLDPIRTQHAFSYILDEADMAPSVSAVLEFFIVILFLNFYVVVPFR